MKIRKWFIGVAVGAALGLPIAAQAGISGIQYIYVSGAFTYSGGALNGTEKVKLADLNSTLLIPGSGAPYTLKVTTTGGIVKGTLKDNSNSLMFSFTNGSLSIFTTAGNNAVFVVSNVKYTTPNALLNNYLPSGSVGSFTGSTTAWNGVKGQGKFNGQFSANTPELGSSVAMATMLLGAGFLGFRRKR